jgi:hypothetical protein
MGNRLVPRPEGGTAVLVLLLCGSPAVGNADTTGVVQGRVFDASSSAVPGAIVTLEDDSTGFTSSGSSGQDGRYYVAPVPAGIYTVRVEATAFRTQVVKDLIVGAGRTLVRDFWLVVGPQTESIVVRAEVPLVERATATVSHTVTARTIREIPLNGRHFIDLGLLVPGAVAPSQTGFSTRPIRGVGALAFNVGGNREEAVGFLVNGVTTNNLTFGSLIFEPPLGSIEEVKVDTTALSAEHGHVSGAIVNIVTRSGTDTYHGEVFEFLRNDALDARNFFEFTTPDPHPFKRNQFGGSGGGPIRRGRTFFWAAYEGLRQRQAVDMNSLVLSDEQRAAAIHPAVRQLLPLIPHANYFDADGTPRFVGSAPALVDTDRWTIDLRHGLGRNGRVSVFYGGQRVEAIEPGALGNSIPGFGSVLRPTMNLVTVGETHTFGTGLVNEARFGRSRLNGGTFPAAPLNPIEFGIRNGVTRPIGLPQMIVAGDLNFGGPGSLPQGRFDTLYIVNDTLSRATGAHAIKLGGEYRHFINENFAEGTGTFNFPTVDAFLAGTANAFNTTLGERRSTIDQRALSLFVQDRVMIHNAFTLELGVRYEWHVTPTERDNKFVVFDPSRAVLVQVGVDRDEIYGQNNRNIQPRVGVIWDMSRTGRTVLRAAYTRTADQPGTTMVRDTAGNPPFAVPLTAAGPIPLDSALERTRPGGLAPASVDHGFRNASLDSWNVNVQRQLARNAAVAGGYLGSRGRNLRISRNINQPVGGVRPYPTISTVSSILPGAALGNISQAESSGFSTYHAAWVSFTRRATRGLQIDTSYTWSKSLDTNSLNSLGFAVQDAYDIPNQYGLSDFDARHRFVLSAMYTGPIDGHVLTRGWQVAAVVQSQSGNPVNLVTSNSTLNGVPNSVRPDVTGPIRIVGSVDQWFDPSVFVAVDRFGNLGRNAIVGPAFHNVDLSVVKNFRVGFRYGAQVRVDAFDVFNHPNLGPPGNIVGSPTFGKITRTRLPTGEAGSSRQIQLAARLSF